MIFNHLFAKRNFGIFSTRYLCCTWLWGCVWVFLVFFFLFFFKPAFKSYQLNTQISTWERVFG